MGSELGSGERAVRACKSRGCTSIALGAEERGGSFVGVELEGCVGAARDPLGCSRDLHPATA